MRCTLRRTVVLALTLFTIAAGATPVGAASAATSPTVSDNPADFTPNVVDAVGGSNGTVLKYQQVGTTMYAAGRIGLVQDATRTLSYQRNNVFAFNATTGEVLPWAPVLDPNGYPVAGIALTLPSDLDPPDLPDAVRRTAQALTHRLSGR